MKTYPAQASALVAIFLTLPAAAMAQAAPPTQSYGQGKALCDSAAAFAVADGKATGMRCVAHPWSKTIIVTVEDENKTNPRAYRAPSWGTVKAMASKRASAVGSGWSAILQTAPDACLSFDTSSIDKLSSFNGQALASTQFYEASGKLGKATACAVPVKAPAPPSSNSAALCAKMEAGAKVDGGLSKHKIKCRESSDAVQLISSPALDMSFNPRPIYYALAAASRASVAAGGKQKLLVAPFSSNPTECISFENKDFDAIAERVQREGSVDKFAPIDHPNWAMNSQAASSIMGGLLSKLKERKAVPCLGYSEIEPIYTVSVKYKPVSK